MRTKRITWFLALWCTLSLGLGAAGAAAQPKDAAAVVNGTVITRADLDRAFQNLLRKNRADESQLPPEQVRFLKRNLLKRLVKTELAYQEAQRRKIMVPKTDVQAAVKELKAGFDSEEEFQAALKRQGLTQREVTEDIIRRETLSRLVEALTKDKVGVTDKEVQAYYEENKDKFARPFLIRASHILIRLDPQASPEEEKAARGQAEVLLGRIKAGADFGTLARENSACPSSERDGDLGWFPQGRMIPAFEEAVLALKDGQVSPVVRTRFGFHLIKRTGTRPPETTSLDQVAEKIRDYLRGEKARKIVEAFLTRLEEQGQVEIFFPEGE